MLCFCSKISKFKKTKCIHFAKTDFFHINPFSFTDAAPKPTENTLPLCPPERPIKADVAFNEETTTQAATTSSKQEQPLSVSPEGPRIFDEGGLMPPDYDNFEELEVVDTEAPPVKPLTVTVKVLIKEGSGNKSIAVVVSLLLCAILLGVIWLGIKLLKGRTSSAKKSASVVVTKTTGKKTADKAEEASEKV